MVLQGHSLLLSHSSHSGYAACPLLIPFQATKAHVLLLTSLLPLRSLFWFAPLAH